MAEDDGPGGEKTHDPTPQKIEKARKKGDIAKSADVSVAASYLGLLVAFMAVGGTAVSTAAQGLIPFIASPDQLSGILGSGGLKLSAEMLGQVVSSLVPLFLVPAAAVLVSIIAQQAFVVAPEKVIPKLNRISPISGAKNKFGLNGMVEFLKTFIKMSFVSMLVGSYLYRTQDQIIASAQMGPAGLTMMLAKVLIDILIIVTILSILVGLGDFLWQKYSHNKKLLMSFQEMRDENKESEGDPHTKNQRRQRGREIATNRMLLDVPKADVIVVNPTHYAVALKWDQGNKSAPKCVAKGEDEIAARIRETAMASGVPIHSDPPTARAIYSTVKIGHEIRPGHYKAIAAALRYAEIMRKKARERGFT